MGLHKTYKSLLESGRRKVLGSVILGLFSLFILLIIAVFLIQDMHISNAHKKSKEIYLQLFQHEIDQQADLFSILSKELILSNSKIQKALYDNDNNKLLRLTKKLFYQWQHMYGITHIYFHNAQRINLLRVHQPNRHGDLINRHTILSAEKSKKRSYGYELGPLGTLTLRVVLPWYEGNKLLGYVEIGTEISHLLKNIDFFSDMKTLTVINKTSLNQQQYTLGTKMLGHASNWNELTSKVVIASTISLSDELKGFLNNTVRFNNKNPRIMLNDVYYSADAMPLIDAGGNNIGFIYILNNVNNDVVFTQKLTVMILFTGFVLLVLFIFVFRSFYGSVEKQLKKLSFAIDQSAESLLITDKNGVIEYVNSAFIKLTGFSAKEAIGKTPRILKSGNKEAGFYEEMWGTILSGEVWSGKVIDRKKNGGLFPTMLSIAPVKNDHGIITNFIASHADLSSLEEMEQQFRQAQKMEAIGTLVGGIAHDFNNILAGMTGNLYLAKTLSGENTILKEHLDSIETLAFRAADMIKKLLTFARKNYVVMEDVSLSNSVNESLELLSVSIPENIEIQKNICSDSLLINGDSTMLHQVLMNLIGNAVDALGDAYNPFINVQLQSFLPEKMLVNKHAYFKSCPYAHLSIEDNGCGIPKEIIEHLFEPFFTTKEQGKGTGLGLAMVFGAINSHHGFIEVNSIKGKGTSFHLYIPLLEKKNVFPVPKEKNGKAFKKGSGETILIVDDERQVVEAGRQVLEELGYQVIQASNGLEAVDAFIAHQDEISLIILDVVMPKLGGIKAAERIKKIQPNIKIIFSTGYDMDSTLDGLMPTSNHTILSKPYSIKQLSNTIQSQLES